MRSPIVEQAALPSAGRVLAICAHPDDTERWCGGTLALLVERGCQVRLAVCTAGEKGGCAEGASAEMVAQQRIAEQKAAIARLGIAAVRFLGARDGELEDEPSFRAQIVRLIREAKPDVIFTHDPEHPWPPYLAHRDHRVAGRVVLDALSLTAGNAAFHPEQIAEGFEPHWARAAWLFGGLAPTTAIDIAQTLERKIVARLDHRSQTDDPDALRIAWRDHAAEVGAPFGLRAAEAFTVIEFR
jgi:LmbE family N-acetylglucosaminyl deacetylase